MAGSVPTFATSVLVSEPIPPSAPVPVTAVWRPLQGPAILITFDQVLVTVPVLDTANWLAIIGDNRYVCTAASATGPVVTAVMSQTTHQTSPDVVTFLPPPHDVVGLLNDLPAPFFINFPVT